MTLDIDHIKTIAEAATPGPWHWVNPENDAPRKPGDFRSSLRTVEEFLTRSVGKLPRFIVEVDEISDDNMEANATFMERISPDVVLELIARLERAEEARKSTRYVHLKSGAIYDLKQIATLEEDGTTQLAVYRSVEHGNVWARPLSEFFAKFVEVIAIETVKENGDV